MIHLREQYWAYPMPKAEGAEIRGEHPGRPYQILSFYGEADAVDLPPGNWQIICTSKTFEAWHALDILEWFELVNKCGFRDYSYPDDLRYPFENHIDSLNSLITSKGCDLNKNYLILKKTA